MVKEEANSKTATGGNYDVFLSFRGPDTHNGFTDCLYVFMSDVGVRVFRDAEELRPGEKISEILRVVKSSQIYIPIFSKDYASSKWCLRELTCMVQCTCQFSGKEILPIFYDVDPSDVKLQTELYKSALSKHEEDLDCTEVKPWKEALTTVSRISGWHLKDKGQGTVIKDIIQNISQKIAIRKRDLPTNLVGIDDRIEAIKKLFDCNASDVRFLIIHGIGGIGKTTLAKAVFNQVSPLFEGRSFLSNIRESSPCGGIVKMQRKLAADILGFSLPETFDFEEGNKVIREGLPHKRVLLVLDDMDGYHQWMQLANHCYFSGSGSRIIITTRDKSVFPMTKVEKSEEKILTRSTNFSLYEMKEMHFDHALLLFNKLAFNRDSTPCDLYDLSREAVALTGGLPFALEEIGSLLHTKSKLKWKSTLKRLKEVPLEKVQQKLKLSYDALGYEAQQIFLDIACFFVNKKITNAMYMWEACDLYPEYEIDVLINKSLIEVVGHDRIRMQDSLRNFGREIIRQENIGIPGNQSRLWLAVDIVQAKKVANSIGNITLLSRLVMEDTGVVKLPDTINGLVDLQYLCLAYCTSLNSLPDAVGKLKSLTELDLSGTSIEKLPRSLCNLKDLKLRINKSLIRARRMGYLLRLEDIEDCSYSERRMEPDGIQFGDLMRAAFQIFDPVYGEREKPTTDDFFFI
ncbi:disease resistance protein RUN1 [Eucalyptus grandis]|uniref:disease resistance protein RUN1 n=1 Tax=Eucalyptus grandis TaxID=71139 RepID=UPI00192ECB59|nr:disease resistance protein RUN1 [Eucalyptus grandis]